MPGDSDLIFGPFRLERREERLWAGEREATLGRRAHAVLLALADRPGKLLLKEELLELGWPDTAVSDAVLTTAIREVRRALGDSARSPRFVETVHGRGYRFVAEARPANEATATERGEVCGRTAERRELGRWLESALGGSRRVGFLAGDPGIGKTTLAEALVADAAAAGAVVARGQCIEHFGAGEPYLPVLEALGRLLRDGRLESLEPALRRHAPSWLPHLPLADRDSTSSTEVTARRRMRELADALEVVAAEHPLFVLLEDLHWSDAATVEWLGYVARRRDPAKLLIVGTYRPVEVIVGDHPLRVSMPDLRPLPQVEELTLDYLSVRGARDVLLARSARPETADALAGVLHERTHGHPLFLVEIVDALQREGGLGADAASTPSPASLSRAVDEMLPEGVRQLIDQQIERLRDTDRALLETAAVIGSEFATVVVAFAAKLDEGDVESRCALLSRARLLLPAGDESWPEGRVSSRWRFRHDLWREVAERRLAPGRRTQLHRRIAECLERSGTGVASELALHFEAGAAPESALDYRRQAAASALERSAYVDAREHLEHALELLATLPSGSGRDRVELQLQLDLVKARRTVLGWASDAVRATAARARALSREVGDRELELRALAAEIAPQLVRGELTRNRELIAALLERTEGDPGSTFRTFALLEIAGTDQLEGRLEESKVGFRRALEHAERGRDSDDVAEHGMNLEAFTLSWGSHTLCLLGELEAARRDSRRAIAVAEESAHAFTRSIALAYDAMRAQLEGRRDEAFESAAATVAFSEDQGFVYYAAWGRMIHGWARATAGDPEGLDELSAGLEAFERFGRRSIPYWRSLLAEGNVALGERSAARRELERAFAALEETEERWMEAKLHRLAADLGGDDPAAAQAAAQRADEIVSAQGARLFGAPSNDSSPVS